MLKISIIIPVYNCERYIKQCFNSIINGIKDDKEVEILIINDGSTDNTKNILRSFDFKNLKIYNNNNFGVSYSRNFGINNANGEYIMFVDADDILDKNWYGIIKKKIEALNEEDIIYFASNIKKVDKKSMLKYIIGNNNERICIAGPYSKLFKKSFLVDENIFLKEDLTNGEDMLFNCEALLKSNKYEIIDKTFYLYRQVTGTVTKSFNENIMENDKKFHQYLYEILSQNNIQYDEIGFFCRISGLYTILDRIGYIAKFKKAKEYLNKIDRKFYLNSCNSNLLISKYKKIIIFLYKNRLYITLFFIEKMKNKYINEFKNKKDEFKRV